MILEKSTVQAGWWDCICRKDGETFVGSSPNKVEAIERCFAKLQWFYSA